MFKPTSTQTAGGPCMLFGGVAAKYVRITATGSAPAMTAKEARYQPDSLEFGRTYYWRVDEVNAVPYPGGLWSFTTQEYAVVDDFRELHGQRGQPIANSNW